MANSRQEIKQLSVLTYYFFTGCYTATIKNCKIKKSTLYDWLKDDEVVAKAKKLAEGEMLLGLRKMLWLALNRQNAILESDKEISVRDLNAIIGTSFDKYRLMEGMPTGITKHDLNLTETIVIQLHEIEKAERLKTLNGGKNRIKDII